MASYGVSLFSRRDGFVDLAFTFRSLNRVAFYRRDQGWDPLFSRRSRRPYHGSIAGWLLNGPIATSGPAVAHPRNQGPSIFVQGLGHTLLWSQHNGASLDEAPLGAPDERWESAPELPDGDDWSDWQYLGGGIDSAPAAAAPDDDRIEVFVRRRDGRLYQASFDGTTWIDMRYIAHAWPDTAEDPDGGPRLASDPVAISTDRDHTHVFAIADDNTLRGWHWRHDNRWRMHNYGNGGFTLVGRPAVSSWDSPRLDVFVPTLEGPTLWLVHDRVGSHAPFDEWLTGWEPFLPASDWIGALTDVEWGVPWDVAAISWEPDALNLYGFDELLIPPPTRELWFEARYEKLGGWIPAPWADPRKSLQPAAP